ncbi:MAG: hypothetical protein ACJASQ_003306 [Crocinitomicaceae bacterium]|jgi:hypothetical protein
MKIAFKTIGILMLSALTITSCSKYDNGGTKARAEKNIKKSWKIESYYLDDVDNTSELLISNFVETFNDDGSYTRTFIDASGDPESQVGTWSLDDDKSLINVSGTGSYELTNQTSTVSTSDYTILKLKKDEMWYKFSNGGSTHEFHLVPN